MPPKQRITREMILEKAFAMFCQEGMEAVNARSVAKALGCSTQPIFSYYSGMEDLKNTLDARAQAMFDAAIKAALGDEQQVIAVCCAYVRFACEQPRLFSHLFLRSGLDEKHLAVLGELDGAMVNCAKQRQGFDEAKALRVCSSMGVYAHGLASLSAMQGKTYADDAVRAQMGAVYQALCA